ARRMSAVAAPLQQPRGHQRVQAPRQHARCNAEALAELLEARHAGERIAQDEHAPPFADPLERARDRTRHVTEILTPHNHPRYLVDTIMIVTGGAGGVNCRGIPGVHMATALSPWLAGPGCAAETTSPGGVSARSAAGSRRGSV